MCSHVFGVPLVPIAQWQMDADPPRFRQDLGELECLEEEMTSTGAAANVDPEGLFDGF